MTDRDRLAVASEIRDIASRIGPACVREGIRDQLHALASKYEFWAGVVRPESTGRRNLGAWLAGYQAEQRGQQ